MTAAYNSAEVERLITEAREDDETLRIVVPSCRCSTADLNVGGHAAECPAAPLDAARSKAQHRALINLAAMADQLEAAGGALDVLAAQVDQTDPQCPIGTALTRAGVTRSVGPEPTYDQLRQQHEALVQTARAYISNAGRGDMNDVVKEGLAREEAGLTTDPAGPRGDA